MQIRRSKKNLMASLLTYATVCLLLFIVVGSTHAHLGLPPKVFDVTTYGAVADGKTDNAKAFLTAWTDACQWKGRSRVLIPSKGTYVLSSMTFKGPCKGPISVLIKGVLKAPSDPSYGDHWITFQYIDRLVVKGGGTLDAQGTYAWSHNDCSKNSQCKALPVSMAFDYISNSRVQYLKSIDSKSVHFDLFECSYMNISNIRLTAPDESPNTDGIRIGNSNNIKISNSVIGTGDDCIAMISGSKDIDVSGVTCGPGHGISIGSLGKFQTDNKVSGITVRNVTFTGTQNGVRIKTWAPSNQGFAEDFTFENLVMNNVYNPIIIDQHYCPRANCDTKAHSSVQIHNVMFNNIRGVSSSKVAVALNCSSSHPCEGIKLVDINLTYNGREGAPSMALCSNVHGESSGEQNPPSCI
ncbi:exopolygalacturonase-like [Cornus florida]|uniref:exopolygalacturonase-like n=1 Tax=Cornus florida TaxID=4283 RepID=UPI00289C4199|nr:exopolygalacturonase-like [Cornus florida]